MSPLFVLDASVAVKWFFTDEGLRSQSLAVQREIIERPDSFIIPILFYSEFIHVVSRKSGNDVEFSAAALKHIVRLGIRAMHLSEEGLRHCATFACGGLSGYDATYVALAKELNGKWLTADAKAAKKLGPKNTLLLDVF